MGDSEDEHFWASQLQHAENRQPANQPPVSQKGGQNAVPFDLSAFSINGSIEEMEKQMLDDVYILGKVALLGQVTVFYAKPNAGKTLITLWMLVQAVRSGDIEGKDVFYVNADDNYRGIVEKGKIAEKHGIQMLVPGRFGFEAKQMAVYLDKMVKQKIAHGKILVLDTLKKFTNIMDKTQSTLFLDHIRGFVSAGGSAILLAHTNKHRDADNKLVHAGTSDVPEDVDCSYSIDVIEDVGTYKTVKFENEKSRGDVAGKALYRYLSSTKDYVDLINSVEQLDVSEEKAATVRNKLEESEEIIQAISACIDEGITVQVALVKEVQKRTDESRDKIRKVLKRHAGDSHAKGYRWKWRVGDNNAKVYENLASYSSAKEGDY